MGDVLLFAIGNQMVKYEENIMKKQFLEINVCKLDKLKTKLPFQSPVSMEMLTLLCWLLSIFY